ncbi:MAG TPA: hypothetical protein VMG41_05225 [Gemmatimonadales bacterium]|nr:hypothetical protein [Gemmatimonadales bacterium]
MTACSRCLRCGAELAATGLLAKQAHAAGLCSDCWLDVPAQPTCCRCFHSAARHVHGARCNVPGCECGHCPRDEEARDGA